MIELVLAAALAQANETESTQAVRVLRRTELAAGSDLRTYRVFEVSTQSGDPSTTQSINEYLAAIRAPAVYCAVHDQSLRLGRFLVLVPSNTEPSPARASSWRLASIDDGDLARRYLEACNEGARQ